MVSTCTHLIWFDFIAHTTIQVSRPIGRSEYCERRLLLRAIVLYFYQVCCAYCVCCVCVECVMCKCVASFLNFPFHKSTKYEIKIAKNYIESTSEQSFRFTVRIFDDFQFSFCIKFNKSNGIVRLNTAAHLHN